MKKVLVLGDAQRIEEFKLLTLQNAEVTYREYMSLDSIGDDEDDDDVEEAWDGDDDAMDAGDDETLFLTVDGESEEESEWDEDDLEMEEFISEEYDIVFDLNFDDDDNSAASYVFNEGQVVIVCSVKRTLSEMVGAYENGMECIFIGMNAFPTFIHRPKLEMSLLDRSDLSVLEATMKSLGLDYELVEDQVGMVAPRVVSMIINEAAFVLGEGTADVAAVDQAMKLGTNYPQGPFEWCDKIGVMNVVALLEALQVRMGDGKYKIAPALLRHSERDMPFYQPLH